MLPSVITADALRALVRDETRLQPALDALCARHHLSGDRRRYLAGSVPVWAVGDAVVKLFPPGEDAHWHTEATVLAALRLPIPTPGLRHAGRLDAWTYLVMDRLLGEPLDHVWPTLPARPRLRLAEEVGHTLAALHAGPRVLDDTFDAFVKAQRRGCGDRQRERGLAEPWALQVDPFLDAHPPRIRSRALLHTEVMPAHLLVREHGAGWTLSGLVDFEPAMVGEPEYELASVGVFLAAGDPAVFDAVVRSWRGEADPELALRVMTWTLLHRYSRLSWYLERIPPRPGVDTLQAVAAAWFGGGTLADPGGPV